MNTCSLLRNGAAVCDVIPSDDYPLPQAASLDPGSVVIVVTPSPLESADGYSMLFGTGQLKPVEIIGSRPGADGWHTSIRIPRRRPLAIAC
ncbi:MAG: hypothetical protein EOP83_23525 [Verrucomicrobiaceae bacterium]|nr:MAG: hypothetical protein EOP83_23525 [Verrucomicrobiaceae bacterium]